MSRRREHTTRVERLELAIHAADRVIDYIAGLDRDSFLKSSLHQDAVTLQIFQIAENLKPLDDPDGEFRRAFPMLGEVIGMRNHIAHEYRRLDMETIWDTASNYVPPLRNQLRELLDSG